MNGKSKEMEMLAKVLGYPVFDIKLEKENQKPMSKKEWDRERIKDLKGYIMDCSLSGQTIDIELLNEYNSLVEK